jgi:hypothetical protein
MGCSNLLAGLLGILLKKDFIPKHLLKASNLKGENKCYFKI